MIVDVLRYIIIGILLLSIENSAGKYLDVLGIRPDLLLIFTISTSIRRGRNHGLLVGFFSGLAQDMTSLGFLGIYALSKSSLGFWLGRWVEERDQLIRTWLWMVIIFFCVVVQGIWQGLFVIQSPDIGFMEFLFKSILPIAVYTGVLGGVWALIPMSTKRWKQVKTNSGRWL
ncbi:MAG: rod shape-determining protein MreD [Calditrichaeota bacterium]|jgi:rod shape-determining protein MreD|nr:rod shape-determining protein MreD [Calditrichota bacterium]MBT7619156.1 rod shape-determining protein MreD [Calditrichota bacterium]MBT7789048.1 rod shape-determining protein MreD [Calditrichota bacterium]